MHFRLSDAERRPSTRQLQQLAMLQGGLPLRLSPAGQVLERLETVKLLGKAGSTSAVCSERTSSMDVRR